MSLRYATNFDAHSMITEIHCRQGLLLISISSYDRASCASATRDTQRQTLSGECRALAAHTYQCVHTESNRSVEKRGCRVGTNRQ